MHRTKDLVHQGHIHGGTSSLDSQKVIFDTTQVLTGIFEKNLGVSHLLHMAF